MIHGEIVGNYPPSTVDIAADKKLLNKFVDNLFGHQRYFVDSDVKHMLFVLISRWEDQFEQVATKHPSQKTPILSIISLLLVTHAEIGASFQQ